MAASKPPLPSLPHPSGNHHQLIGFEIPADEAFADSEQEMPDPDPGH